MRTSRATFAALLTISLATAGASGQEATATRTPAELRWLAFPDSTKFQVLGLYWFDEDHPKLWRMPARAMDALPKGVQGRSRCPSGGRIAMRCTTTQLAVRALAPRGGNRARFAAFVDGRPCEPAVIRQADTETELLLFREPDPREKEIVIYLPHIEEVVVQAIGVDEQTRFRAPERRYARPLPIVFYGSSVCQGSGALSPGQSYPAILGRALDLDLVNLGFGGAGKAEADVVDLVGSIPACCYVFDLGKSYGKQDATAFEAMLRTVRRRHPEAPIVVITPITSARELRDPAYSATSVHTRQAMRDPVKALLASGEERLFLVEGEDLLGFKDHAALSKDGVHPSDEGYELIATRLAPVIRKAIGL